MKHNELKVDKEVRIDHCAAVDSTTEHRRLIELLVHCVAVAGLA
jgi:hypothetical protein